MARFTQGVSETADLRETRGEKGGLQEASGRREGELLAAHRSKVSAIYDEEVPDVSCTILSDARG